MDLKKSFFTAKGELCLKGRNIVQNSCGSGKMKNICIKKRPKNSNKEEIIFEAEEKIRKEQGIFDFEN